MFLLNILKGDDDNSDYTLKKYVEQELIEAATTQGIWVLLFVSLFLYTIKNNEKLVEKQDKREENYQKLLSDMTEKYAVVEDIRNSVDEIQKKVEMLSTEQKV